MSGSYLSVPERFRTCWILSSHELTIVFSAQNERTYGGAPFPDLDNALTLDFDIRIHHLFKKSIHIRDTFEAWIVLTPPHH